MKIVTVHGPRSKKNRFRPDDRRRRTDGSQYVIDARVTRVRRRRRRRRIIIIIIIIPIEWNGIVIVCVYRLRGTRTSVLSDDDDNSCVNIVYSVLVSVRSCIVPICYIDRYIVWWTVWTNGRWKIDQLPGLRCIRVQSVSDLLDYYNNYFLFVIFINNINNNKYTMTRLYVKK